MESLAMSDVNLVATKVPPSGDSLVEPETQLTPLKDQVGKKKKRKSDELDLTPSKGVSAANESFVSSTSERIKRIMLERPSTPASAGNDLANDLEVSSTIEATPDPYRLECSELRDGFTPIPETSLGGDGFIDPLDEIPAAQEIPI